MVRHAQGALATARSREPNAPWVKKVDRNLRVSEWFTFAFSSAESRGRRAQMEDALFIETLSGGNLLAAVFDGHGGAEVASFLKDRYKDVFIQNLQGSPGDIYSVFIKTSESLQEEISKKNLQSGSTACVCYIDKEKSLVYTATLADAEAFLYCKESSEEMTIMPLSDVRDPSHLKEVARIEGHGGEILIRGQGKKYLRIFNDEKRHELNVTRAFGDPGFSLISHKPKVTVQPLKEGVLVIASDGLYDNVTQDAIMQTIQEEDSEGGIAQKLVKKSVTRPTNGDNVSVVVIKITKDKSQ